MSDEITREEVSNALELARDGVPLALCDQVDLLRHALALTARLAEVGREFGAFVEESEFAAVKQAEAIHALKAEIRRLKGGEA